MGDKHLESERVVIETYLQEHGLETTLNDAVNAVVKARPRDPYVQLGKALLKASDGADAVAAVAAREILGSSGRPALEVVVDRLWALSKTGVAAVVHCRRGDKITNSKYCPAQMEGDVPGAHRRGP